MLIIFLIGWLISFISPELKWDIYDGHYNKVDGNTAWHFSELAQTDWIGLVIEYVTDFELDEDEIQDIISYLEEYAENPVPISSISESYLANLFLLSSFEISDVLGWVASEQELLTFTSFQSKQVVNPQLSSILQYFIVFEPERDSFSGLTPTRSSSRRYRIRGHVDYRLGMVQPRPIGYEEDGIYLGNRYHIREITVLHHENVSIRSSRNKVPGELASYPTKLGQMTGSIAYRPESQKSLGPLGITSVVFGDFRIRFGFGNIAAGGTMRAGPRNIGSMSTSGNILAQNGSSTVGSYLRGMGLSGKSGPTEVVLFASSRDLTSTQNDSLYYMPSWSNHARTKSELARQKNNSLSSIGLVLRSEQAFKQLRMQFGGMVLLHYFDKEISQRPGLSYRYDMTGTESKELSVYAGLSSIDWQFGFELSHANGEFAWIGLLSRNWDNLRAGVWHRYYDPGFKSVLGNAPSAFSGSGNEHGLGSWIRIRPAKGQSLDFWTDRYKSMALRFGTVAPVIGHEFGVNYQLRVGRTILDTSIRQTNRMDTFIQQDEFYRELYVRYDVNRIVLKLNMRTQLNSNIQTITRLEHNSYAPAICCSYGSGVTQVVIFNLNQTSLYVQYSTIQTDSYQNRVYIYEYDMLGAFRVPALSGYAQHGYVMIHQDLGNRFTTRMKVSRTIYSDRFSTGSGNDLSPGRSRNRIDAQIRIRF